MKKDLRSFADIFKQEGTSRNERYSDSLNPDNVSLDDRTLEDFIIYAQKYSKNLLFVDTANEEIDLTKTWESFFKDDLVLLSANIAKKGIKEIKEAYDLLYNQFHNEETIESFSRIVDYVFSRFSKIDQWYASSSQESTLNQELFLYIRSYLSKDFQNLKQIIVYINNLTKDDKKLLPLSTELINKNNVWELTEKQKISLGPHVFEGKNDKDKLYNALLYTNKIFDTVFHATSRIIDISKNYFKVAIYSQQNISPHITLYITFVKLFGIVQQELNKMPARLLSFYYKDVLRINAKNAVPDQAFVIFELVKGFGFCKIEKGTRLLAGKDKKKVEITYKTDKELIVSNAQVDSLKTIFIGKKENLITQYYGYTLKKGGKSLEDNLLLPGFPMNLYGLPLKGKEVQTGFAIASNQLYLAKGERNVNIIFETRQELIFTEWENFDISIFELQLTGEKGWISSNDAADFITINYLKKTGTKTLELNFNISIAQSSAIVAFDPEIHSGKFNIHMPVLKIMLQFPVLPPKKEIPDEVMLKLKQLNFLQTLNISGTNIGVQVGSITEKVTFDGIRDLELENHETELEPHKPFYPFTTIPKVDSSFYIGCNDLFYKKNIENLSINIDWMLPDNFDSYYDKYFHPYDSNKFMASLSVLKNRQWSNLRDISLIDTTTDEPRFRVIKVPNKPRTTSNPAGDENDVSRFDVSKKDGTLKLKLKYPDFGHDIYPQLVTSIAMEKATSKMGTVDFYQVIKKELADSEISIKLPDQKDENYRINVVLDILKTTEENDIARRMINDALNYSLTKFNGVTVSVGEIQKMSADPNRKFVNDDNFIERIIRFLKKVKLIDKHLHYDRDKDTVENIVEDVNNQLNKRIDFILPADEEMVSLVISEVNNAIRRIVAKAADKITDLKKTPPIDENTISGIITKEIDIANEVINDMVAKKIATLLSAHDIPPKPYTPLINSISISYSSTKDLNKEEDHFFHILPFGLTETTPLAISNSKALFNSLAVPTGKLFPGSIIPTKEKEVSPSGINFIGIKELAPNENLTLYFQIDQSTKRSGKKPPNLNWWYLRNNEWIILDKDAVISDSTYGFQTTGIVEISIPHDINNQNTIFDVPELYWLSTSVSGDTESFPGLIDLLSQAVTVTFENNSNDPLHLADPLPSNKISRFEEMLPAIKTIRQPDATFGGKVEETEMEFYSRVSERLRHKSRAVNNWDYEHLVLEQFPFIFKVKCINNYYQGSFIPGHVTVVPIMNLKNKSTGLQSELPIASYLELRKIEEFLNRKSSAFVKIHAINPMPEYVLINCKVKFKGDVSKGFYIQKLNEDLIKFLSPWTSNADTPSFSAKIYSSSIINFIDKMNYVDYVADLSMNQYTLSEDGTIIYSRLENQTISLTETQISTLHSILVSAGEHNIELL